MAEPDDTTRLPSKVRLRLSVLLAFACLAVACDQNRENPPCECPFLEQAMDSIDWAPGVEVTSSDSYDYNDESIVTRGFRSVGVDEEELFGRVLGALGNAGFSVAIIEPGMGRSVQGPLRLEVTRWPPITNGEASGIKVQVFYSDSDGEQVITEMEPIRAALATG